MVKTERLELVSLEMGFSDDLYKVWGDYDVIKYTNNALLNSPEECYEKLVGWLEMHRDLKGSNKFAIITDGIIIGIAGFPVIDHENFKCGFFYQIMKTYWNHGYGQEAAKGMLSYIYKIHKNAEVIADVVVDNTASVKILNKLGFQQTGIEEKGFKRNGMELDIYHFEMKKMPNILWK